MFQESYNGDAKQIISMPKILIGLALVSLSCKLKLGEGGGRLRIFNRILNAQTKLQFLGLIGNVMSYMDINR